MTELSTYQYLVVWNMDETVFGVERMTEMSLSEKEKRSQDAK
jgi:hypothetical protein